MKTLSNASLILTGLSLLLLTSCQGATDTAKNAANTATNTANKAVESMPSASPKAMADKMAAVKGIAGLSTIVTNTKAAVEKGDFAAAKAEFSKFEDVWKTVEDGVKKKSPASYDGVEKQMEAVNTALKGASPDKAKVLAALQGLGQQVATAAKP